MARGESRLSQYTLEEVQGQFQSWRAQRKKGQRIPEELWKAAIGLYSHYSIYKIARALRLDHMDLKERINRIGKGKLPAKHEPHFIEFPFSNGAVNTSECCKLPC